jgi:8-oxo-dGTP pyrophosphatase MutT (NUDIX family)
MGIDVTNPLPRRTRWSSANESSAKFVPLAKLRKLRECEQVAAVCYRLRNDSIEFLLVRTRGGRWIFPKGNAEPGLTHARAAALEAFEEAGVHGRMQEACFSRYTRGLERNSSERDSRKTVTVNAYLCEVLRLESPQESGRNPTWFSAEKAKRVLREDRTPDYGSELARVINRALARIALSRSEQSKRDQFRSRQVKDGTTLVIDGLQNVQFIDAAPRNDGKDVGRVRIALP